MKTLQNMKLVVNPTQETITEVLKRPKLEAVQLDETIRNVFREVEQNGDQALKQFTAQFDGVQLDQLKVSKAEIERANE
ncbi:MAG: histidinol dehydrogenase, partial [Flavobacteriia bacterium]|nr:histidinol dehydrogenase [Flavobacteriia bacterium]